MPSRWLKCTCTKCDATWRMTRKWANAAGDALVCPVCTAGAYVGDDPPLTDEDRASIEKTCAEVADNAGEIHSPGRRAGLAELKRRRVHIERKKRGVCTGGRDV